MKVFGVPAAATPASANPRFNVNTVIGTKFAMWYEYHQDTAPLTNTKGETLSSVVTGL
jgi:hypothetical protein